MLLGMWTVSKNIKISSPKIYTNYYVILIRSKKKSN